MGDFSFSEIPTRNFYGGARKKTVVFDLDVPHNTAENEFFEDDKEASEEINFNIPDGSDLDSDDDEDDDIMNHHVTADGISSIENHSEQFDSEDEIPLAQLLVQVKNQQKRPKKVHKKWKWKNVDSMYGPGTLPPFLGTENIRIIKESPVEYFMELFSENIVDEIVFQSNLYAVQNNKSLNLTNHELYVFLGINLIMSYIRYPRMRLYWSSDPAIRMDLIADSMAVNRFELILRHLHFTNNLELDANNTDKLKKIRPFLDKLQKNFLSLVEPEEYQAIDEQIVPLKGRIGLKQYLPKKPKKWGVKIWVRAGVSGYMYRFEVYQGAGGDRASISDFGASADVVLRLSDDIGFKNHKLFFDNLFSSIPLIETLKKKQIWATGTLRSNRLAGAEKILDSEKELKRRGRGSASIASTECGMVTVTKWIDSNAIHVGSSCAGLEPQNVTKRWCKSTKTAIEVSRPFCVKFYNKNMGGVDLLDQLLALYPLRRRNKRWYIRIFMHFLDVALINAWIAFKKAGNTNLDLLEFKASVGRALINTGNKGQNKRGRPRSATPPESILKKRKPAQHAPLETRKDGIGHWPKLTDIKNARRCHSAICKRKTKFICKKCQEPCCPGCMEYFHS